MPVRHSTDVIDIPAGKSATRPRVASELLICSVLQLISQYGAVAANDSEAAMRSAAAIELHLKTLAALPDMEPILQATCQQLSEQWGMLLEQQARKSTPSAFVTRLISGPSPRRTT
ncbi:MAG: hypothetical protein JWP38_3197 [Herbaspirillum sp.]|jgi:hypothetical protein|nr:hypothetical protein [Herbaspirillum sp.]